MSRIGFDRRGGRSCLAQLVADVFGNRGFLSAFAGNGHQFHHHFESAIEVKPRGVGLWGFSWVGHFC